MIALPPRRACTSCALTVAKTLGSNFLQGWDEIGDIPGDEGLNARHGRARRFPRVAQRLLELVQRPFLAALAQRPKRPPFTLRFRPDRRDRDHLFMQACRARAIDGEPAHQHDTRLRAWPHDHGDAR